MKHAPLVLGTIATAGVLWIGFEIRANNTRLQRLEEQIATRQGAVDEILGEVTRMRLEQRADGRGPSALLEMLRTYAPILVSARYAEPDYQYARDQMQRILRAFETVGEDAWQPVMDRIAALDGSKNFDELKWLLEAAVRIDEKPAIELVHQVTLGQKLPAPRLRWFAADLLLRHDRQLAQTTLRQILLTESSRGVNPERAAAYGVPIPDIAATATTGFHNFVLKYVQTEDREIDETLLMVMGRTEHDLMTVQTCVKELGARKCARAAESIRELYQRPPGHSHNPLFQVRCLDAIAAIEGEGARSFFESMLDKATTETVAKHLERLLGRSVTSQAASVPLERPGPQAPGPQSPSPQAPGTQPAKKGK